MSWVTGELYAGSWTSSRYYGHGILAENAPSEGEHGASILYLSEYFGKEVRAELITPPQHGTLDLREDGSFGYIGDGTSDSFVVLIYADGAPEAENRTIALNANSVSQDLTAVAIQSLSQFSTLNVNQQIALASTAVEQKAELVTSNVAQALTVSATTLQQNNEFNQLTVTDGDGLIAVPLQQASDFAALSLHATQAVAFAELQQFCTISTASISNAQWLAPLQYQQLNQFATLTLSDALPIFTTTNLSAVRVTKTYTAERVTPTVSAY